MTLTAHDRKYLAIAMPAAMEGVFMNLLGMADLVMVGALGTLSIAAIGVFEQPRMVLLTVARSFASVIVLLVARHVGAGRRQEAGEALLHSVFITMPVLAVMHLAAFLFVDDVLLLMGAKEEYFALAHSYAAIAVAAVFFLSMAIDAKAINEDNSRWHVFTHGGRNDTGLDALIGRAKCSGAARAKSF